MIKSTLLHPEILSTLAATGHGAVVLIADSNYPFNMQGNPLAKRVYLNLAPGMVSLSDVLKVLLTVIPVESADAIVPDGGDEPAIFAQYRALMPDVEIGKLTRFPFYAKARASETVLVIATGEQRTYACIMLTIGVIHS